MEYGGSLEGTLTVPSRGRRKLNVARLDILDILSYFHKKKKSDTTYLLVRGRREFQVSRYSFRNKTNEAGHIIIR